jgi:L,D-transpeptidase ErfK/SrfK
MRFLIVCFLFSGIISAQAQSFTIGRADIVGEVQTAVAKEGESLAQVARDYDMGYVEMLAANPNIDDPDHLVAGTVLVVPSQFVLPNAPRDGIVVNLAEMRLYYYPPGGGKVITHPMGIGREGEDTPMGMMRIIQHIPSPTWHVPESIRKMRAEQGVILPKAVPPGPDNPLGDYAMRLSNPTYLIHGTNDPLGGIGRRSSSGCLRMYPEDIQTLYHQVSNGTPVYVVNAPYKAGWSGQGELYLESHISLQSEENQGEQDAAQIRQVIQVALKGRGAYINWDKVKDISSETQGFPQIIGRAG